MLSWFGEDGHTPWCSGVTSVVLRVTICDSGIWTRISRMQSVLNPVLSLAPQNTVLFVLLIPAIQPFLSFVLYLFNISIIFPCELSVMLLTNIKNLWIVGEICYFSPLYYKNKLSDIIWMPSLFKNARPGDNGEYDERMNKWIKEKYFPFNYFCCYDEWWSHTWLWCARDCIFYCRVSVSQTAVPPGLHSVIWGHSSNQTVVSTTEPHFLRTKEIVFE